MKIPPFPSCLRGIVALAMYIAVTAGPSHGSRADVITDWNRVAIDVSRTDSASSHLTVTRVLTMVHVAQFDAVNATGGRYSPYLVTVSAPGASAEAAAAQAAYGVLRTLFPTHASVLNTALAKSLSTVGEGASKAAGTNLGAAIAAAVVRLRESDGSTLVQTYRTAGGVGRWVPTPPDTAPAYLPNWRYLSPWTLRSTAQFRPDPPPALTDPQYAADLNEVRRVGKAGAADRTVEQTEIARFHDDVHVFTLGHAARDVINRRPMPLSDSARLFALMYLASADSAIACWEAKYTYGFWRPITAIRGAAIDGNPATEPEASWSPLLPTPAHPEYPSGHSAIIGAGAAVLELLLGDEQPFTTTSSVVPNKPHHFSRFSALVAEVIDARVFAGAHFRNSNTAAAEMGRRIARHVVQNSLVPVTSLEGAHVLGQFKISQRTIGSSSQRLEYSTDLVNWLTLTNFLREDLSFPIIDTDITADARRFYRAANP